MAEQQPCLSKEQLEKLEKLEAELERKRKYEETSKNRRLAASKRTGIPYSIVDIDVIKVGMLLGLIKNLDDNKKNNNDDVSLLDLFLGIGQSSASSTYDYSKVPPYFVCAPNKCIETDRVEYHKERVKEECDRYCNFITDVLGSEHRKIEDVVSMPLQQMTMESFVENVKDTMSVVLEMLLEDDEDDSWKQLLVLRNSLACVVPICEYKNIVSDHISQLMKIYRLENILEKGVSCLDGMLTLLPGKWEISQETSLAILTSLVVRSHTRDPELKPFDMSAIIKECCTPAIVFVDLNDVIVHGIIGPYWNNPIGFMYPNFYMMKCIIEGVRLWVMDSYLTMFSEELRISMLKYAERMRSTMKSSTVAFCSTEIIDSNISQLRNPSGFRSMVCKTVSSESQIVPSEADVFDNIPTSPVHIRLQK